MIKALPGFSVNLAFAPNPSVCDMSRMVSEIFHPARRSFAGVSTRTLNPPRSKFAFLT
ncbi:hypothetical protein AVDCRST_MAG94-2263 [uncultured Leptolyngbya sp.]|uniref:Uncharacterized protein n=1 Tax=uncultured Leptolyngbya sp. TaxID=332963 RepID=A0A6J4LRS8_9CYAN|nr:hypothetical protein AVDCRST_MAG94-2263 [uncultured Leptolyngbya sp.]